MGNFLTKQSDLEKNHGFRGSIRQISGEEFLFRHPPFKLVSTSSSKLKWQVGNSPIFVGDTEIHLHSLLFFHRHLSFGGCSNFSSQLQLERPWLVLLGMLYLKTMCRKWEQTLQNWGWSCGILEECKMFSLCGMCRHKVVIFDCCCRKSR